MFLFIFLITLSSRAKRARDLQLSSEKCYYVYIMASRSLNLYTGVTNSIYHRALQHKSGEIDGFTKKYNINRLVYYEVFEHIGNAIAREKQVKAWTRAKRLALIKSINPTWQDLSEGWSNFYEETTADSSAALRNDKQKGNDGAEPTEKADETADSSAALRNDKQKGNDKDDQGD